MINLREVMLRAALADVSDRLTDELELTKCLSSYGDYCGSDAQCREHDRLDATEEERDETCAVCSGWNALQTTGELLAALDVAGKALGWKTPAQDDAEFQRMKEVE